MTYTTLDKIVRGVLLQKRWPIHFYIECLTHSARCLEELSFDVLKNVRALKLPVNSYGAVTLPCDYMDWCKVGIANGQFVKPLTERQGISRLNNYEAATGNKILFADVDIANYPSLSNYRWGNNNGEFTGIDYGSAGDQSQSFKVVKERNEIQLNQALGATDIILEYISDGSESDNATQITPYAKATIEAYIFWKYKENARSYSDGERRNAMRLFEHHRGILRGRLSDLTIEKIKQSRRRNTHGSIKG